MGNGTPAADALLTALLLDLRMSRVGARGVATLVGLGTAGIADVARRFVYTVCNEDAACDLPFGTKVETSAKGYMEVGGEVWLLDAARPGLHPMEAVPRGACGPNLDLLRSHIGRLTRGLACRRIGLPSPVQVVDTASRHLLQFPPCAQAGGVVLQR